MDRPSSTPALQADLATLEQPAPSRRHISALDGIRGLAILVVLVFHLSDGYIWQFKAQPSGLWQVVRLGWSGVNMFFVLSGFLITGILLDSRDSPQYFRNFYARRALRIFPLYFAFMTALTLALMVAPGVRYTFGTASLLWTWLYATNISMALYGWMGPATLIPFWSLAVEEHFYLVWPLLIARLSTRVLLVGMPVLWAAVVLGRTVAVLAGVSTAAVYALTPFRLDALVLGGFLALLLRADPDVWSARVRRSAPWLAATAALLLALLVYHRGPSHEGAWMQSAGYTLFDGLFASLVVAVTFGPQPPVLSRMLSGSVLRTLGKYSYGLYVIHSVVLRVLLQSATGTALWKRLVPGSLPPLARFGVEVAVSLAVVAVLTYASWHLLEKRALAFKRLFA